jgi:putative transposase
LAVSKEGEAGIPVAELTRKHGIGRATYFNWRSTYAWVSVNELKRMKELEAENAKLKRLYAEVMVGEHSASDLPRSLGTASPHEDRLRRLAQAAFRLDVPEADPSYYFRQLRFVAKAKSAGIL